ncbi:MAG: protease TldD [Methanocella sp. PtaU1.Bin125]|nr:MAG: protease TldD [Methanocella sp. PtaU1.Bin125]
MIFLIRAVSDALDGRADYYDVRILHVTTTSIEMKNGGVTRAVAGTESGACVRVLFRGAWGFASAPESGKAALGEAADRAARIAKGISETVGEKSELADVEPAVDDVTVPMKKNFMDVPIGEKVDLIRAAHDMIKKYEFVTNDLITYKDTYTVGELYSSEGASVITRMPRVFWQLELAGRKDGQAQSVRRRIGRTSGLEALDDDAPLKMADSAVASLIALLNGKSPPSGPMPVIADPDLAGVFAHEAVGHAAEADLVATGNSCFAGRIGEQIGSDMVTIRDDATLPGMNGSMVYDDEGVKAGNKVLIRNGILNDFIQSRETAAKLGMAPNGGARAESYHGRPLVRMSNTLFEAGDRDFKEMIEGVRLGVYAKGTRGGQVNTAQGFFQFNAQESYLIENGEITKPLRDVSLSGRTLDILKLIDAVGADADTAGVGICGKGQQVPVGQGGPHIRISRCVVGGR